MCCVEHRIHEDRVECVLADAGRPGIACVGGTCGRSGDTIFMGEREVGRVAVFVLTDDRGRTAFYSGDIVFDERFIF